MMHEDTGPRFHGRAAMPSAKRPTANGSVEEQLRKLKRENKELREKLKEAEEQRRHAIQAWAKTQITEKDLARWEREIKKGVKGGSLTDLIRKLEREL
jgi:hypothetical protein